MRKLVLFHSVFVLLIIFCGSQDSSSVRLSVYTVNTTALRLQWSLAASDFNFSSFFVRCDDEAVAETSAFSFVYNELAPGTAHWCSVDVITVTSGIMTVVNGTTIRGQTMIAPSVPDVPSDITHFETDNSIRLDWNMSATAYDRGVTHYTVHRDGLLAGSVPLVAQPVGSVLSYLMTSLSPATEYRVAVAAHNFYGTSISSAVTVTSLSLNCSRVTCAAPPVCNSTYMLPTAVAGLGGCCGVFTCTCVQCPSTSAYLLDKVHGKLLCVVAACV